MIRRYSAINEEFWQRLERNEITKQQVLIGRYEQFFAEIGVPVSLAVEFNRRYQVRLGDTIVLRDDSYSIVKSLRRRVDIRKMLEASGHNRRVTLDLDEVVFRTDENGPAEKPLPFPFRNMYKERLRLGIPALFRYLGTHGYDVWVYSADYYSIDYIRNLFRMYHAHVAGIVTGTARKAPKGSHTKEQLENRMKEKYPLTLHIDNSAVTRIDSSAKEFTEYPLSGEGESWSKEIMDVIAAMEEHA